MPRRKTPIEQHIAEQGGDRRAAYEKRQREAGLVRTTLWLPEQHEAEIRALLKGLCDTPAEHRSGIIAMALRRCKSCRGYLGK